MIKKRAVIQFFRFAIVGVINTLINLVALFIFTDILGVYYLFSAVLAFLIANINSFIMNKSWTFNEKKWEKTGNKYVKFFIISIASLLINLVLLYFFTDILGVYYMFSQILAIAVALWINFLGNKLWTFKD